MGQSDQAVEASVDLGRKIARAREDAGISQIELATTLGWSARTLSNLERGRRPIYTPRELSDIAMALNVSATALRRGRIVAQADGLGVGELLAVMSDEQLERLAREVRAELRSRS